jgi:Domain of unknown function (DUF4410)
MNRPSTLAAAFLGMWCCAAVAPAAAQQPEAAQTNLSLTPADKDKVIYVSNFDLENLKADEGGIAGKGSIVPPPILPRPSLRRKHVDPDAEAKKLVDLMSNSVVSDLSKTGLTARRLLPGDTRPSTGLLVSGVFTELDEGNQMRRALIGFGSGAAKMDLYVTVSDLSRTSQSLYDISKKDTSGKRPGAVITLNPYAAALKVGLTKDAPEKNIKKAASQISAELTKELTGSSKSKH